MIINNNIFRYSFVALHDPNSGSFMMNKKGVKKRTAPPCTYPKVCTGQGF